MRPMLLMALCAVLGGVAAAQEPDSGLGGYTSMKIERVGRFRGSFDDDMTIKEMTGGVSITLLSDDPAQQPLPIRANTMRFEWEEDSGTPARIEMEGNVDVQHPKGHLTAEKGVWDFKKGVLEFTGNPVLDSPRAKGVRGTKMTIDFKANNLDIENMQADMIPMRGGEGGGEAGISVLAESDIQDWAGFVNALKAQAKADAPSPGKRMLGKFDKDAQARFMGAPTDAILQQKPALLKQLNKILRAPGWYSKEAWNGLTPSEETQKLLAEKELAAADQAKLNLGLFKAAFAEFVAAP